MTPPSPSHAPPDYDCPFCHLARREHAERDFSRLSDIVWQTETVTVFVASHQYPRNAPNMLVIPNRHYENIFELPPELGADIQRAAQKIAIALKQVYHCDGISTRQHNEPAGSQDVWHYHLHVTPRFRGDRFYLDFYDKERMDAAQRAEHAARLRAALSETVALDVARE